MLHIDSPRVLMLGDIHGRDDVVTYAVNYASRHGIDTIIQIGDYWAYLDVTGDMVEETLAEAGITLYFIPGNHEHWNYLDVIANGSDEPVELSQHVVYLPKNTVIQIGNNRTLCLGGAVSVDKKGRIPNVTWFDNEVITYGDALRAMELGEFDIVLTHDCPDDVNVPDECFLVQDVAVEMFGEKQLNDAQKHRELLEQALKNTNYSMLIHGHYHHGYMLDHGDARVIGLGMEKRANSMAVLDVTIPGEPEIDFVADTPV